MKLFYLKNCPYCRQALAWIQELYQQDIKYQRIPLEMIEESEQSELADTYDYYYVPCFFEGTKKLHEGAITKETIQKIFDDYLREENK
jgi:glutaredoxin